MKTSILPIALLVLLVAADATLAAEEPGPLEAYVAKQDDSFRWVKRREGTLGESRFAELTLTSQTWRGIVWRHQVFVIKPSEIAPGNRHALLYIAGGRWRDELARPDAEEPLPGEVKWFAAVAEHMKTPVAVLRHVPQQPIFDGLVEDEIISLTFEKYLRMGDAEWPLLLPMVKSAVRAMDSVEQFAGGEWSTKIETYTVSGASKRGWTTWLVGAVDRRVTAIAPMVIDLLKLEPQMKHQLDAWGAYSHKLHDYTARKLPRYLGTEGGRALQEIVDPYHYRTRLTQPKLILLGTNDPYWPLDALNLYWDDLADEKYILYVPNAGHSLGNPARVFGSINALHQHAANGRRLPKLSWEFSRTGNRAGLRIESDLQPAKVVVWTATAPKRDFRHARWQSYPTSRDGREHVAAFKIPESGYGAMFGEAMYNAGGVPYFFSTNVRIATAADGM